MDCISPLFKPFKGTHRLQILSNMESISYVYDKLYLSSWIVSWSVVSILHLLLPQVPPYVILFMVFTSYRVHSIYVLRLFNCSLGILVFYFALYLFTQKKWALGSAFYSYVPIGWFSTLLQWPFLYYQLCSVNQNEHSPIFACHLIALMWEPLKMGSHKKPSNMFRHSST